MEVEVYQPSSAPAPEDGARGKLRGLVQAGPASSNGYIVAAGSQWTPRELYVLRLDGDVAAYLGDAEQASGRLIVKVGLAASPDMRRQAFQKAMPRGAFKWVVHRTTTRCGLAHYPSHAVAVKGEDAMKRHLADHADKWLGGEFYLATEEVIDAAWHLGCQAASENIEGT
jgi:hypothetical protein